MSVGSEPPALKMDMPPLSKEDLKVDESEEHTAEAVARERRTRLWWVGWVSCLVLTLYAMLWYSWHRMAVNSHNHPADQLLSAVMRRTLVIVNETLQASDLVLDTISLWAGSKEIVNMNTPATGLGVLTSEMIKSPCTFIQLLQGMSKIDPGVFLGIGAGFADGSEFYVFYDAAKSAGDPLQYTMFASDPNNILNLGCGNSSCLYSFNSTGCIDASTLIENYGAYDPRIRPWYLGGLNNKRKGYTEVYGDVNFPDILLSAAYQPIFAANSSTILGVMIVDVMLSGISTQTKAIAVNGVSFISETVNQTKGDGSTQRTDLLVAASHGSIAKKEGTNLRRLQPTDPDSEEEIRRGAFFLSKHFANGGLLSDIPEQESLILSPGSVLVKEPMVGSVYFMDPTGDLKWRIAIVYDEETHLDYVLYNMVITAIGCLLVVLVLAWCLYSTSEGRPLPQVALPSAIILCVCLWVMWLVTAKYNTTNLIDDTLKEQSQMLAEYITWSWEDYFDSETLSTISYHLGQLPLDGADAPLDTRLDTHFAGVVARLSLQNISIQAAYAGFPTGDLSGMQNKCDITTKTCRVLSTIRHSANTSGRLDILATQSDSTGTSYVRTGTVVATAGSYDATTRDWYKDGVKCGRLSATSRNGDCCFSHLYTDATSGVLTITFVQSFYNAAFEHKGVLAVDIEVDVDDPKLGSVQSFIEASVPNTTDQNQQYLITQHKGDVVYANDRINSRIDSSSLHSRLLATDSSMSRVARFAESLWEKWGSFMGEAQKVTSLSGKEIKVSSTMGVSDTRHPVLYSTLSNWTQLTVSVRSVYYSEYDIAAATSFGFIVFGFTLVIFEISRLTEVLEEDDMEGAHGPLPALEKGTDIMEQILKESAAHQANDDSYQHERLLMALRIRLQPFVDRLEAESEEGDFHRVLLERIQYYSTRVYQAENEWDSRPVVACMVLEGRYGRSHWRVRGLLATLRRPAHYCTRVCLWAFMLCELVTNVPLRVTVNLTCLTLLSFMFAMRLHGIGHAIGLRGDIYAPSAATHALLWPLVFLDWLVAVPILGFVRPVLFFMNSAQLRQDTRLVLRCVWEIRVSLIMFFAVVSIAGLMAFTLYRGKFDSNEGQTIDDFLDAFLWIFVVMESGENYPDIAYQGARLSVWSWVFFLVVTVVGVYLILSMVLALFGSSWDRLQTSARHENLAKRRSVVGIYFALCIWDQGYLPQPPKQGSLMSALGWPSAWLVMSKKTFAEFVNVFHPMSAEAASFVFKLVDQDESGTAELAEIDDALFLGESFIRMQKDPLIAHKVVVARNIVLVEEQERWLAAIPPTEANEEDREHVRATIDECKQELAVAEAALEEFYSGILGRMLINGKFTMQQLDDASMVAIILFCMLTTLKIQSSFSTADQAGGLCFNFLFCVELLIRFRVTGFVRFWDDPRGAAYSLQNKVALFTSVVGMVAAIVTALEPDGKRVTEMIQLLPLWRVLVMHRGIRGLMESFTVGIQAISSICLLMFAVFFFFCQVAFVAFKDNDALTDVTNFSTLLDTYIVMFQVGIGPAWYEAMEDAVDQTYEVYNFFFVLYVVLVGVLFTNLVVGILVNVFQSHTICQATIVGEMSNIFPHLGLLPQARKEELQKEMGVVAKEILNQDETSMDRSHSESLNISMLHTVVDDKRKALAQVETELAKVRKLQLFRERLLVELNELEVQPDATVLPVAPGLAVSQW